MVFSCFQRCSSNTRLDLCTFIGKIDANEFVSGNYLELKSSFLSIIRDYRRIWEGFRQKLGLLGLFIVVLSAFVTLSQFAPGFINLRVQVVPALRIVVAAVHYTHLLKICILYMQTLSSHNYE